MAIQNHVESTVESLFFCSRMEAESFLMLCDEIKNTLEFFYKKISYHAIYTWTKPSMIEALITLLNEEIIIFRAELKSSSKSLSEDCLLPSVEMPDLFFMSEICEKIVKMDEIEHYPSYILPKFNSLKRKLKEIQNTFSAVLLCEMFYSHSNLEERFNRLMEKYEKEHLERIKIYIEDFESADAVKASLREEYKDNKAVKCWKDSAHDIKKTLFAMYKAGCVERDLLPLFEYILKGKMLEWKFGWQKNESEMNEVKSYSMKRNTQINIYDCPSVNIGQAQDIISEGGTKNVYNHKKL